MTSFIRLHAERKGGVVDMTRVKKNSKFSVMRNQLLSFVRKEFYHVLRDRKVLLILFGMPVMQVLLFGFVLSNEVKDTQIAIVDYARDNMSKKLIYEISSSRHFLVKEFDLRFDEIEKTFRGSQIKAVVVFPANFNSDLEHNLKAQIQIITDATDINSASTMSSYLSAIIGSFMTSEFRSGIPFQIIGEQRMLFNPQLKGAPNFVPGVMAMVLMLVCVMMTAVAIVKEKEMGTMEVLLVSPMKPALVICAKAVPYLILSCINLSAILLLSTYVLDVPVKGSLGLLLAESVLFIITCLTLGILISINTESQQTAMFASLIGMLLPTIMLSGFMFPIENMPYPLQLISNIAPSRWFYVIVKNVMIKGAGISSVWKETLVLVFMTLVLFGISLKKFKIRLA